MDKKGYIYNYGDVFKGIIIGAVIGAAIVYLIMTGMIDLSSLFGSNAETTATP